MRKVEVVTAEGLRVNSGKYSRNLGKEKMKVKRGSDHA